MPIKLKQFKNIMKWLQILIVRLHFKTLLDKQNMIYVLISNEKV